MNQSPNQIRGGKASFAAGTDVISIKPHHFVDILTALGGGHMNPEPHPYGHALHRVTRQILDNRDIRLRIELGADDICRPCRHNVNGQCDDTIDTSFRPAAPKSKEAWNLLIDTRWCERLILRQGDTLTARQLCERIREHAGDITDIYREIPAARTAEKQTRLQQGIATFLQDHQKAGN